MGDSRLTPVGRQTAGQLMHRLESMMSPGRQILAFLRNAGVLSATTNSGALGLTTGSVVVNSGATLGLQTTVAAKALTLNGTGLGNSGALPQGALVNQANANLYAGDITLTGTVGLTGGTIPLLSTANTGTLIGAVSGTTLLLGGAATRGGSRASGVPALLRANPENGSLCPIRRANSASGSLGCERASSSAAALPRREGSFDR